jgi:hypothetical protein
MNITVPPCPAGSSLSKVLLDGVWVTGYEDGVASQTSLADDVGVTLDALRSY